VFLGCFCTCCGRPGNQTPSFLRFITSPEGTSEKEMLKKRKREIDLILLVTFRRRGICHLQSLSLSRSQYSEISVRHNVINTSSKNTNVCYFSMYTDWSRAGKTSEPVTLAEQEVETEVRGTLFVHIGRFLHHDTQTHTHFSNIDKHDSNKSF